MLRARHPVWAIFGLSLFLLTASCAHRSVPENQTSADGSKVILPDVASYRVGDPAPPAVASGELETIPDEMNEHVQEWISYFQGRGREHMERYLARMTLYGDLMKRILRKNGLPEDLIYIALIESGFTSKATSHAAAVGYWQFIRGTGKRYGLGIDSLIDERRDPVLSTQAAAEYFKGLYSVFGSWYLAMASYNAGENKIKKVVMKNFTRDFWELAKKRRLPKETTHYIPKFIAAKMIGHNPAKYGFANIEYEAPVEFETVKVKGAIDLKVMADKMNLQYEDLKLLNPKFRGVIAPAADSAGLVELRIPTGQTQLAMASAVDAVTANVQFISDTGEDTRGYKVRPGETIKGIARKFRTTVAWLRDVNDLDSRKRVKAGRVLQVPDRDDVPVAPIVASTGKSKRAVASSKSSATAPAAAAKTFYVVQHGDTLASIAEEYDSTINELRKLNKLKVKSKLKIGMRLKIPDNGRIPDEPSARNVSTSSERTIVAKRTATPRGGASALVSSAPPAQVHVVRRGENLRSIAEKYGISIAKLLSNNKLVRQSRILVGARLLIPVAHAE